MKFLICLVSKKHFGVMDQFPLGLKYNRVFSDKLEQDRSVSKNTIIFFSVSPPFSILLCGIRTTLR